MSRSRRGVKTLTFDVLASAKVAGDTHVLVLFQTRDLLEAFRDSHGIKVRRNFLCSKGWKLCVHEGSLHLVQNVLKRRKKSCGEKRVVLRFSLCVLVYTQSNESTMIFNGSV